MIETKKKPTFKTNLFEDIIDEIKKPMSLNEIMTKYNVTFPFTVKCVKEFYSNVTGTSSNIKGRILTYTNVSKINTHSADAGVVIEGRARFQSMYSKKFILWE